MAAPIGPLGAPGGDRPAGRSAGVLGAMSIDVEDWFHVENLRRVVPRHTWRRQQLRVERTMDSMLEAMAAADVKATCFVLGWLAERAPQLVRRIAEAGHEVAAHGYGHRLVYELRESEFREDVRRSKDVLEGITGRPVRGYRAPCFSLVDWAIPVLLELGFTYDSSFFPTSIAHDRYGKPAALRAGERPFGRSVDGLTEVSLSCLPIGALALPWAGGGYFRLLPYRVFKLGVGRILRSRGHYVFYIHPWELDPEQPRVGGLRRSERFRHYVNLDKTERRFASLLEDFRWTTIADLLSEEPEPAPTPAPQAVGAAA